MIAIDLAVINTIENLLHEPKYYLGSRERSSSYNTSCFRQYKPPYRSPSKQRTDRYRSRSHSKTNHALINPTNPLLF